MNNYLHWLQRSQINSGLGDFCIVLNEDNIVKSSYFKFTRQIFDGPQSTSQKLHLTIHLLCHYKPSSQGPSPSLRAENWVDAVVRALANDQCGTGSIPSSTSYVSWICWFSTQSTLLWQLSFSNTPVFHPHQKPKIWLDLLWFSLICNLLH